MTWLTVAPVILLLSAVPPPAFEDIRDLIRHGQFPEALAASEQYLKLQPRDARVWTLKGIALQSLTRRPESLEALRHALVLQPEFPPALQASAQIEYETGDPAARKTLERLIAIRPDPAAHAMLGVLAFERKDCAESASRFENASVAISGQPLARWQFATCLFQLDRFAEAEQQFVTLLADKEDNRIRYNLGLARFAGHRYPEAIAALEPLSRRDRPESEAVSILAAAYEANEQTQEAVAALRRAIELYPTEERLYIDLAGLCLEHQSLPLAVEIMETGLKNNSRSARMQTVTGLVYARVGNTEKALEHYAKADKLAPRDGFGPVAQSMMLLEMGAADEAVNLLRAQRLRGRNAQVDLALAQALLQKGVERSQLPEVDQLLSGVSGGNDGRVYTLRAKLCLLRDQPEQAAQALEAGLKLNPNDRSAAYLLMTVYRRLGRSEEMRKLQVRVKDLLDTEKREDGEGGRYRLVSAPVQAKVQ